MSDRDGDFIAECQSVQQARRIAELERRNKELDAHVERIKQAVKALSKIENGVTLFEAEMTEERIPLWLELNNAIASTPAQSLAAIRQEEMEELAAHFIDRFGEETISGYTAALEIRARWDD